MRQCMGCKRFIAEVDWLKERVHLSDDFEEPIGFHTVRKIYTCPYCHQRICVEEGLCKSSECRILSFDG